MTDPGRGYYGPVILTPNGTALTWGTLAPVSLGLANALGGSIL